MLQNWLHKIQLEQVLHSDLEAYQFGAHLQLYTKKVPSLKNTKLAIIGTDEQSTNSVRRELYRLSFPFKGLKIADLGTIRKEESSFLVPLLKELLDSGILPILLSSKTALSTAQYKAHKSQQKLISYASVGERIPFNTKPEDKKRYPINEIVHGKRSKLFHIGLIGAQAHFIDTDTAIFISDNQFDLIRLGNAKAHINGLEPIIRDGDLLSFQLNALKRAEIPDQTDLSPSGFTLEEACQICRYAGMSDKLKSFGLFGFNPIPFGAPTAQGLAQMLWYFIDGYFNRKNDYPASTDGLLEYLVDFKGLDKPLTFWKSQKTGRWWMQVPVKTTKKYDRHYLIPCSLADYQKATQGELADRLFNAYKRFA